MMLTTNPTITTIAATTTIMITMHYIVHVLLLHWITITMHYIVHVLPLHWIEFDWNVFYSIRFYHIALFVGGGAAAADDDDGWGRWT